MTGTSQYIILYTASVISKHLGHVSPPFFVNPSHRATAYQAPSLPLYHTLIPTGTKDGDEDDIEMSTTTFYCSANSTDLSDSECKLIEVIQEMSLDVLLKI